jgi:hypothetical protein
MCFIFYLLYRFKGGKRNLIENYKGIADFSKAFDWINHLILLAFGKVEELRYSI